VAQARGLTLTKVHGLVTMATRGPQAGTLGAPRVNVLTLNVALDRESASP